MNVLTCACAILVIASCAGCAAPAPASDSVRVTLTPADVAGCTLLGKVIVSETSPDVAKDARDQTVALGGNALLRKNELVWNGNAYHCPAAGH